MNDVTNTVHGGADVQDSVHLSTGDLRELLTYVAPNSPLHAKVEAAIARPRPAVEELLCEALDETQGLLASQLHEARSESEIEAQMADNRRALDTARKASPEHQTEMASVRDVLKRAVIPTGDSATLTQMIAMLRQREAAGLKEYGQTVDRTDFSHVDWLREALHESMDKSLYLLRAIETAPKWQPADAIPDLQAGTDRYFQIAVKRPNGKVYSYPALYCNSLALSSEDTEPCENSGNRWRWHFLPEHLTDEGDMGVTGWYDAKSSSEYDSCYCPALDKDDELMGWHELPQYLHTEYPADIAIANNGEAK